MEHRVLIAEGERLVSAGLRALLERQGDLLVTAEVATAEAALATAQATRPDVVLLDADLHGALETARRLTDVPVAMLLSCDAEEAVLGALRAGATGLLLKDAEPDELVAAVRAVAGGQTLLAPVLARRVVAELLARPERLRAAPEGLAELTAREREVMTLVACGLSNAEIAERLVVTRATAKTHVSRALCKLHAHDRAQLVVLAYEAGLVRPGDAHAFRRAAPVRVLAAAA
ncbi:MAG TPA: response regulator transcription factor [Solirubrobacter sp.]|nr:response regulator transcription factor [Solirubrobacter sp.]